MRVPSTARISAGSARHPWRTVGVWLGMLVAGAFLAGMFLSDALTTDVQLLDNPESVQGENLLESRMGYETPLTETIVVSSDSLTVDDPEFKQVVDNVFIAAWHDDRAGRSGSGLHGELLPGRAGRPTRRWRLRQSSWFPRTGRLC